MAVFHLECSIHRQCASGLSVATDQIVARTDAEAISRADASFANLVANRAGSATLWDDAGQIIWSTRRPSIVEGDNAMDTRHPTFLEAIAEGAHARTIGLPKDSCPYHPDMPERQAWLDGYDGTPREDGPDVPMADA